MNMRDHLVGRVLDGRYEIVQRVARGGMATVYLATDRRLTRTVAIKVMHEGLGDDQEFARKFDREARAVARLSHPNIVSVFDQGLDGGRPYIVMEYVEGRTLRNVITTQAPLDPIQTLDLLEPIVAAVAAAHEAGLIHRDIKPENVLISARGRVKVVDFGLARSITGQTATATQGLLLGTVSYIAPELVTEGRPRPASDVYSIGVVLFEMLTGTKPHTGENPIQVAYSHVHKSVPKPSTALPSNWLTDRSAIPPYLDALVTTATSRELKNRPEDARVLLSHVRAARHALDAGVTNDPALNNRMTLLTLEEVMSRSPVSPETAPPRRMSSDAPTMITPAQYPHSASTPVRSNGRAPEFSSSSVGSAESPVTAQQDAVAVRPSRTSKQIYRRRRLITLLVLVALVATLTGVGGWWMSTGRYTETPRLVGMTEAAALSAAEEADVVVDFTTEFSETIPAGQIIATEPLAGERILRSDQVTAAVSKGPERYTVPTLTGLQKDEAVSALAAASLVVGNTNEEYNETVEAGIVTASSQKPGGQLKKGTTVDLTVSKGPRPIAIGDYTSKPLGSSQVALEKAGFKVAVTGQENSATVPSGSIISQTPKSGNGKRGDTISVVVSKGPVMVTVPSVRAMNVEKAKTELTKVGLEVKEVTLTPNPLGLAISTDPAAGSQVPEGSSVTLNIA